VSGSFSLSRLALVPAVADRDAAEAEHQHSMPDRQHQSIHVHDSLALAVDLLHEKPQLDQRPQQRLGQRQHSRHSPVDAESFVGDAQALEEEDGEEHAQDEYRLGDSHREEPGPKGEDGEDEGTVHAEGVWLAEGQEQVEEGEGQLETQDDQDVVPVLGLQLVLLLPGSRPVIRGVHVERPVTPITAILLVIVVVGAVHFHSPVHACCIGCPPVEPPFLPGIEGVCSSAFAAGIVGQLLVDVVIDGCSHGVDVLAAEWAYLIELVEAVLADGVVQLAEEDGPMCGAVVGGVAEGAVGGVCVEGSAHPITDVLIVIKLITHN
jgi:hypothetical protein